MAKTQAQIDRELDILAQKSGYQDERISNVLDQARSDRNYLQPSNVQLASITQGFDANTGTGAGAIAYDQGVDFGASPYMPEAPLSVPVANGVMYNPYLAPDNLENYNLEKFYSKVGDLNKLGMFASSKGINVNQRYGDERDVVVDEYQTLLSDLSANAEALKFGAKIQEEELKKGHRLSGEQQSASTHAMYFNPQEYDDIVKNVNDNVMVFDSRGERDKSNLYVQQNIDNLNKKADLLDLEGKTYEAQVARETALQLEKRYYSSIAQQKVDLDKQELQRKKDVDAYNQNKSGSGKKIDASQIADLERNLFLLANQDATGWLSKYMNGARVVSKQGGKYLVYKPSEKSGMPNMTTQEISIPVENKSDIVAALIKENKTAFDFDLGEWQKASKEYGEYKPSDNEAFSTVVPLNAATIVSKAMNSKPQVKEKFFNDLNAIQDFLKVEVNGKQYDVVDIDPDFQGETVNIKYTTDNNVHQEIELDLTDEDDIIKLNDLVNSANNEDLGAYLRNKSYVDKSGKWVLPKSLQGNSLISKGSIKSGVKTKPTTNINGSSEYNSSSNTTRTPSIESGNEEDKYF